MAISTNCTACDKFLKCSLIKHTHLSGAFIETIVDSDVMLTEDLEIVIMQNRQITIKSYSQEFVMFSYMPI